MRNWKTIRDTGRSRKLGYNLALYYQAVYRREHFAPETPETLLRAGQIQYMLEQLPLTFSDEQEFYGGRESYCLAELPPDISQEQYDAAIKYYNECVPRRNFHTGHDHTTLDYRTIVAKGLGWYIRHAEECHARHQNPVSAAMLQVLKAVSAYFVRLADAYAATRPEAAQRLRHVSTEPPASFAEALQLVWLLFVILEADGARYACALARIDQYLYEPYKRDTITDDVALDYICHVWTKIDEYREVTNICIGGLTPDGKDAWNELSLLMLKATDLVHSPHTNLSARLNPLTSDECLLACIDLIKTGIGFPAIFNDGVEVPMMQSVGVPLEAARDYALFGCVEPLVPGREVAWSDGRFSMPDCFLRVALRLMEFNNIEEVIAAYIEELRAGMKKYADAFRAKVNSQPADKYPDPYLSAFTRDCIGRGKDINDGGAEFPRLNGVGMMGLATMTDSLAAIKKLVFDEKKVSAERLVEAIRTDYKDDEVLRQMLLHRAPKYGNDIDTDCDDIACRLVQICDQVVREQRYDDGGYFLSAMASNIQSVSAGAVLGATPDGRHAGEPLSDAASPYGGRDHHGPTAFVNSIVKPDYTGQACTVVNMRFQPSLFASAEGRQGMLMLLKRFIDCKGQEMQFNVTGTEKLQDAMEHPEKYNDLIVRVSGFSAFFNTLSQDVKKDILRRTSHQEATGE